MFDFFGIMVQAYLFLILYFTAWYIVGIILKNAGIVDVGWGAGFVLLAAFQWVKTPTPFGLFLLVPVFLWGTRLAFHIGKRNFGKAEDFRYAAFRKDWGKSYYLRSYFQLFMFQGLLMGIISMPFLFGMQVIAIKRALSSFYIDSFAGLLTVLQPLFYVGLIICFGGLLYESVADRQLKKFTEQKENRGRLIKTGLWKTSRHPNYFGESVFWWGLYLMALSYGAPWWSFVGPLTITLIIRFVSGVPMLEKRLEKKAGYAAYAAEIPIFVPFLKIHRK